MASKLKTMISAILVITIMLMTTPVFAVSTTSDIKPTGITITANGSTTIGGGSGVTLTATVTPTDATYKDVIWSSSNSYVATVDYSGNVLGMSYGTATIFATTKSGGKVAKTIVTVSEGTRAVLVTTPVLYIKLGQAPFAEKATLVPSKTTYKTLNWTTDNAQVATVDSKGNITPVGIGDTTIKATIADNIFGSGLPSGSVSVHVIPSNTVKTITQAVYSVQLFIPDSQSLSVGSKMTMRTTVLPSNASNKALTYKSSNESVATVSPTGVVTALTQGSANITASTINGISDSLSLNVNQPATKLSMNVMGAMELVPAPSSAIIKQGSTFQVIADITPSNVSNSNIAWFSSNSSVASIEEGIITALSPGTSVITGATTDGSNKVVKLSVTVPVPVTGIQLAVPAGSLAHIGKKIKFKANVLPVNAANKAITWSSSDISVATVNNLGEVTMLKEGDCTITVSSSEGSFQQSATFRAINPITTFVIK